MVTTSTLPAIVQQKLAEFSSLEEDFEASFQFVEAVHGQQRFSQFPIGHIVHYLHALWICECKTCLLSVPKTVKRYEGQHSLQLLKRWQEEKDTVEVVDFLHRQLDMLPLGTISRQIHEARYIHANDGLAQRLLHGRTILLNRGFNLMQALDAIFSLPEDELFAAVHTACEQYGHLPEQIARQLTDMQSPLYTYVPHQVLARRNMRVMNQLAIKIAAKPEDLPGQRSWRVVPPTEPLKPFAEHVIRGYLELNAPHHNNLLRQRFVDRPEQTRGTPDQI
jgi:hypothetical protein